MPKTWKLKDVAPIVELEKYRNIHPAVAGLLWQRGVEPEQVEQFLHVKYEAQHDPFLFVDMRAGVDRIWRAIETREKIAIYGDYDADAVTANAVLQQTFQYLGVEVGSYIPDRFAEGYGLNIEAFEKIKASGAKVVITVDCGTNSCDVADWCLQNNIDLIITDHHEITAGLPNSFALINPKNSNDKYPDPQITGVGVAYKLARALLSDKDKVKARFSSPVIPRSESVSDEESNGKTRSFAAEPAQDDRNRQDTQDDNNRKYVENWDKWLLDLVAIGTVADCHSLLGENRIFVKYGLMVLAKTKWPGLRALLNSALGGKDVELTTHTLGWLLAPRINAAGRLEHANIALDTLLEANPIKAGECAQALENVNLRRQDLTARLISEAREQATLQASRKVLVLDSPEWPKGIVGIAAGRLVHEFGKPVIVLERGDLECTGSARTYGNFNIVEALKATSKHLSKFGGHKEAAGLTLETKNLESFKYALEKYADSIIVTDAADEVILDIDLELAPEQLSLDFFDILEELAPFGAGNPKPLFWIKGAIINLVRKVGSEGQHVQFTFNIDNVIVQAIAFNLGRAVDTIQVGSSVEIAAELLADAWNGVRRLKLRIVDIKLS